jgi:hypothetical protein
VKIMFRRSTAEHGPHGGQRAQTLAPSERSRRQNSLILGSAGIGVGIDLVNDR